MAQWLTVQRDCAGSFVRPPARIKAKAPRSADIFVGVGKGMLAVALETGQDKDSPTRMSALRRRPRRQSVTGSAELRSSASAVYLPGMIAVKAENDHLQVTIPTTGMTPGEVNDFVSWLRVESVVRRSQLTPEAAAKLSEDLKAGWWQANERRFTPEGAA